MDYFDTDRAWEKEEVNEVSVTVQQEKTEVESVTHQGDLSLQEQHDQITALNAEIAAAVDQVKNNPALVEFAATARDAGAFGVAGLLPKIPALLPELAPLGVALQKLVEVGEKQHALTGQIVAKLEGAE